MTKYIAHYKDSRQISPDDFDVFTEMLECDEKTTLKEVMNWAQKRYKGRRTFTITQPEIIDKRKKGLTDTENKEAVKFINNINGEVK